MKNNLDFEKMGLVEMNQAEMEETKGGGLFGAIIGAIVGAVVGVYVAVCTSPPPSPGLNPSSTSSFWGTVAYYTGVGAYIGSML